MGLTIPDLLFVRRFFEPTYEEFKTRTIWSLSNAYTSAFNAL